MKILFILLIACLVSLASAENIYKWTDAQGNVHYGDEPNQGGAKKMGKLPGLSTYAPPPIKTYGDETGEDADEVVNPEEKATSYRSVSIVKPEAGDTIRSNPGIVEVFVAIAPPLGKKDHIRVTLDGKSLPGRYSKTVIQLENVDRGEHQVNVAVYNNKGKKLKGSASHTFYLHKATAPKKTPKN